MYIVFKLQEVFGLKSVSELPISYNIAWYEQKTVIVLLSLLHLGVKSIHLGATLPAFLSPNVAKVLVDSFGIGGITNVEDEMKDIIMGNPEIGIKVLEAVVERLSKVESLVQNLATNDVDSRIAYLLTDLMEKYGEIVENNISIELQLSREDMANFIAVTRETISRKLKKFEDEQLIKIVGTKNIIILGEEGLKDYI